jgi:hypothetical protein
MVKANTSIVPSIFPFEGLMSCISQSEMRSVRFSEKGSLTLLPLFFPRTEVGVEVTPDYARGRIYGVSEF